jgi:predicted nucleotidyltransferase
VQAGEQGIKAYGQECIPERVRGKSGRNRDGDRMDPPSPPTLDELRRLAPAQQSITAAHGALGLQVFGSVVHGSARPGSDLDLLAKFPASPSFERVMDLKLALEDLLSVPVDLVTRRGLRAELRQRIQDEAVPLLPNSARVSCCRWSGIDRPREGAPASPTATL